MTSKSNKRRNFTTHICQAACRTRMMFQLTSFPNRPNCPHHSADQLFFPFLQGGGHNISFIQRIVMGLYVPLLPHADTSQFSQSCSTNCLRTFKKEFPRNPLIWKENALTEVSSFALLPWILIYSVKFWCAINVLRIFDKEYHLRLIVHPRLNAL